MAATIEDAVREVEGRWDPVTQAAAAGLQFKSVNGTQANLMAHCPFHNDQHPSLSFHRRKGLYCCFSCGEHGSLFQLLGHLWGLRKDGSFMEVLRRLAEVYGVEVPKPEGKPARIRQALQRYCRTTGEEIWKHEPVVGYLAERGIEADIIDRYGVGYAVSPMGIPLDDETDWPDYIAAGLFAVRPSTKGDWTRIKHVMRKRITFPIKRGKQVVNISGRVFPEDEHRIKYLNLPGRETIPWGLSALGKGQEAVLVEGAIDAILSTEAGRPAIANMGIGARNLAWLELLPPESDLVLAFDDDEAGRAATKRLGCALLSGGVFVRVVSMIAGFDPASIISQGGAEAWRAMVDQALPWPVWAAGLIGERNPVFGRPHESVTWILRALTQVPNLSYKEELIREMADSLNMTKLVLHRYMLQLEKEHSVIFRGT